MIKKALILAAGFGRRMGELTKEYPKPLIKLNGIPLIDATLFFLKKLNVNEIAVNLHYHGSMIESYLQNYPFAKISFWREDPILGTAGTLRSLEPDFAKNNEALFLANPDEILLMEKGKESEIHRKCHQNAHLYLKKVEKLHKEPGWVTKENNLIEYSDQPNLPIYMGFSICKPEVVSELDYGRFAELGSFWKKQSKAAKISGSMFPGKSFSCGTIEDYNRLAKESIFADSYFDDFASFRESWHGITGSTEN